MAAASVGGRVAGKILGDYLTQLSKSGVAAAGAVGRKVAEAAAGRVPGMAAGSIGSQILEKATAGSTLLGGAAAVGQLTDLALGSASGRSRRSEYSLPLQQQQQDRMLAYQSASALQEQKYQHDLALIQARARAATDQMQMGMTTNMVDPMSIANQMFKSQGY